MKSASRIIPHNVILKEPPATEGSHGILRCAQDDNGVNDRLAAAKKFANELNDSRLWKIKISYQKRWTAHRRRQKSMEIHMTRPWLRATGPKTAAGKYAASRNAFRHCGRDRVAQILRAAMRDQKTYLRAARSYTDPRLCRPWGPRKPFLRLVSMGNLATKRLLYALFLLERDDAEEDKMSPLLQRLISVTDRNNQ